MGLFEAPKTCRHCGATIKGKKANPVGVTGIEGPFYLCPQCYSAIGEAGTAVFQTALKVWTYEKYLDYLNWYEEMKKYRESFKPDYQYFAVSLDTVNGLFSLDYDDSMVYRMSDLVKEYTGHNCEVLQTGGLVKKYAVVKPYLSITLNRPYMIYTEDIIDDAVKLPMHTGPNGDPQIEFPEGYIAFINAFFETMNKF